MKKRLLIVCVAAMLTHVNVTVADVLMNWNLDGLNRASEAATKAAPSVVHDGVTVSDLTFSPTLKATSWSDALTVYANELAGNLSGALGKKSFFTFTVTPKEGKKVSFSSMFNRVSVNTGNLQTGATIKLVLLNSIDGFTTEKEVASFEASHPIDNANATETSGIFDLSGVESLQHVNGAVEFRVYAVLVNGVGNRLGYGHIFYEDGQDDLRVEGMVSE